MVKVYENTKTSDWAIREMMRKMGTRDRNGLPHASELYNCFRKGVLNRRDPRELGAEDILRFAVGFAVQEWFFGPEKDGEEHFGVILSADHTLKGQVLEFKTTRMSIEKWPKDAKGKLVKTHGKDRFDPTEVGDWIPRTLAYMVAHNVHKAHILVFFLFQGEMSAWTIEADDADLKEARLDMEARRDVFNEFLADDGLPSIETRAYDKECSYCPFYDEYCFHELTAAGVKVTRYGKD